jgi:outer membrane protein assembly factor BamB
VRLRFSHFVLGGVSAGGLAVAACGGDSGGAGAMDGAASADGRGIGSSGSSSSGGAGPDGGHDATNDAKAEVGSDAVADQRTADQGASDGSTTDASGGDGGTNGDGGGGVDASVDAGPTGPSVLQHHKNASRDGFYIDPALTKAAIHTMHLDTVFSATTSSQTFSEPLLMAGGVNGQDALFVATENNDVYALNPMTGMQLWTVNLGTPANGGSPCAGSITPLGVAGTPVIDPVGRAIYLDAATGGATLKHMIFSLSVDTGKTNWSLDVSATISNFDSTVQNQRGALTLVGGKLFVPYGGFDGDCGNYKGWVVAVPVNNPTAATGWVTPALSGPGIWAPSGVASDGTSLFVATCNTNANQRPTVWTNANSEAIIKLSAGPAFSGNSTDYFAPTDWLSMDQQDADLGSSGVVLFDAPNATPSHLAFGIGKTQTGRLVDRTNLGGIGNGLSSIGSNSQVFGALFAYTTAQGTYVGAQTAFSGCSGDFGVLKVSNTAQLSVAWCANSGGSGGPISSNTSANGGDAIVWSFGAAGDGTLRAWDADTGMSLPLSSSVTVSGGVEHWTSPIIANGRIYVAGDGAVYAFGL